MAAFGVEKGSLAIFSLAFHQLAHRLKPNVSYCGLVGALRPLPWVSVEPSLLSAQFEKMIIGSNSANTTPGTNGKYCTLRQLLIARRAVGQQT